MENIMLNVKKSLINALFIIVLTCGLSNDLQAADWSGSSSLFSNWGGWTSNVNPRNAAANLYQRFNSWYNREQGIAAQPNAEMIQRSARIEQELNDLKSQEQSRRKLQLNTSLRKKLELIQNKSGNQEQLWNVVKSLVEQGADVSIATKREIEEYGEPKIVDDLTALHLAAIDRPDMVEFLIEKGANKKQKNADGYTYEDIIKASQEIAESRESQKKSKVTQSAASAKSNLKLALKDIYYGKNTKQNWEIVRDIISRNRNLINTDFFNYWTPLHLAVNNGNTRMVSFLMGYGANPNLYNGDGETAFDIANHLIDGNAKTDILKFLSKEFSPAQFGSPYVEHKSLQQIIQEGAPSFVAPSSPRLVPAQELEHNISNLVEKYTPRSSQKKPLEEAEVPEPISPMNFFYY